MTDFMAYCHGLLKNKAEVSTERKLLAYALGESDVSNNTIRSKEGVIKFLDEFLGKYEIVTSGNGITYTTTK